MKDDAETKMKAKCCELCDNYKFAIMEIRGQRILKFLQFISVLTFVAVLVMALKSYIPCLFLLLLIFIL